jgi:hypothetical protein
MDDLTTDRRMLHFLHERRAIRFFTRDFEFNEDVFARGMAHHCIDIPGSDLQGLWLNFPPVNDGWDKSAGS